jgi:hypothetical protein
LARIGPELWTHFSRPRSDQAWYYRSLVEELAKRIEGALLTQLKAEVEAFFAEDAD